MMSVGMNVTSSSGVDSSGEPPACAWVFLTLEEQLTNFKRIFRAHHSDEHFSDAYFKSIARIAMNLREDLWIDIASRPYFDLLKEEFLMSSTPFHWAVLMDDRTMVRYILTSGRVDINASTMFWKETALHYAITSGNLNIVEDLLEHKADVCACDQKCESALYYMVLQKDSMFGILKKILANNVNVCDKAKNTTLHHAAKVGAANVVIYLLDEEADVNLRNEFGYTPLFYAAKKGFLCVATCLLQHSVDANMVDDDDGWSLLHVAVIKGSMKIVRLLVEHNANVNAMTKDGQSPLLSAIDWGHLRIAKFFIEQSANVNIVTWNGGGLLHIAVENGYLDTVTRLLERDANVNTLDKDGWSPLHYSLQNQRVDISNELIATGANVHVKDKQNNNTLHLAILAYGKEHTREHNMDIVKLLQEQNIDVNAKNAQGYSPFFASVAEGHTEVVKELLQRKEKIKLMEECNGQTMIQIAYNNGHEYIKRALFGV